VVDRLGDVVQLRLLVGGGQRDGRRVRRQPPALDDLDDGAGVGQLLGVQALVRDGLAVPPGPQTPSVAVWLAAAIAGTPTKSSENTSSSAAAAQPDALPIVVAVRPANLYALRFVSPHVHVGGASALVVAVRDTVAGGRPMVGVSDGLSVGSIHDRWP